MVKQKQRGAKNVTSTSSDMDTKKTSTMSQEFRSRPSTTDCRPIERRIDRPPVHSDKTFVDCYLKDLVNANPFLKKEFERFAEWKSSADVLPVILQRLYNDKLKLSDERHSLKSQIRDLEGRLYKVNKEVIYKQKECGSLKRTMKLINRRKKYLMISKDFYRKEYSASLTHYQRIREQLLTSETNMLRTENYLALFIDINHCPELCSQEFNIHFLDKLFDHTQWASTSDACRHVERMLTALNIKYSCLCENLLTIIDYLDGRGSESKPIKE